MNQMPLLMLSATKPFMKTINPQNSCYRKHTVEIKNWLIVKTQGVLYY